MVGWALGLFVVDFLVSLFWGLVCLLLLLFVGWVLGLFVVDCFLYLFWGLICFWCWLLGFGVV